MSFLARTALAVLAAVFLASCSVSGSMTPSSGGLMGGALATGPNYYASYVKVTFRNETAHTLHLFTAYSYPLIPGWLTYKDTCVKPNGASTTDIGFDYPDPQVLIAVRFNADCVRGQKIGNGSISFKQIPLFQERAAIASEVTPGNDALNLCGRQTHPIYGTKECVKLPIK